MGDDEPSRSGRLSRRSVLRGTLGATATLAGASAFAGRAAADKACCFVCWVDLKPNSCPNSINPDGNGVTTVAAGWPNFEEGSVELVPVKGAYDAPFDGCQDYRDPTYDDDCAPIHALLDGADGRSATPVRRTVEDLDGDGDGDTVFKFQVEEVGFEPDDAYVVLVGEAESGCTVLGVDSVRVLEGGRGESRGTGRAGRDGS